MGTKAKTRDLLREDLLSVAQAARFNMCSTMTIYRRIREGRLEHVVLPEGRIFTSKQALRRMGR